MSSGENQVNFAVIPEWILYSGVSAKAVHLYAILNRHANKERKAWPSRSKMQELMRVKSVRTVDAALDELEEAGAVTIRRHDDPRTGRQTTNRYILNVTPKGVQQIALEGAADCTPGVAADCEGEGAADCTQNYSQKEREPKEREKTLAPVARKRDLLFEALAEVCGIDWRNDLTSKARGQLVSALKDLRAVNATPEEIFRRGQNYRATYPNITLTPTALAKHWPQLTAPPTRQSQDRFLEQAQRLAGREGFDGRSDEGTGMSGRSLPA